MLYASLTLFNYFWIVFRHVIDTFFFGRFFFFLLFLLRFFLLLLAMESKFRIGERMRLSKWIRYFDNVIAIQFSGTIVVMKHNIVSRNFFELFYWLLVAANDKAIYQSRFQQYSFDRHTNNTNMPSHDLILINGLFTKKSRNFVNR